MNRHWKLMFFLGVAYLTTADVPSSTDENSDTKIITSREVSRTQPPLSELSTQTKFPLQDELTSRGQSSSQSPLSTQSPLLTESQLTTQYEFITRCEPTIRCEPTTRNEHSTLASCSDEDVNESNIAASTTVGLSAVSDELRDQVMRLTSQLSKAVAALHTAQQRERKIDVLEREKYSYLKAATEKVLSIVDNVQHSEKGFAANTSRERQIQQRLARDHRIQRQSRRKMQAIRRLLVGADVGLMHIESSRALNRCRANSRKPTRSAQQPDKLPSRNRPLAV